MCGSALARNSSRVSRVDDRRNRQDTVVGEMPTPPYRAKPPKPGKPAEPTVRQQAPDEVTIMVNRAALFSSEADTLHQTARPKVPGAD